MVTILRDTWLKPGKAAEGIRLTRRIWSEMRQFEASFSIGCSSMNWHRHTCWHSPVGGVWQTRT
ncbi:MAG: hypothetical protein U0231_03120 [Nitrospiraceae bacterium]